MFCVCERNIKTLVEIEDLKDKNKWIKGWIGKEEEKNKTIKLKIETKWNKKQNEKGTSLFAKKNIRYVRIPYEENSINPLCSVCSIVSQQSLLAKDISGLWDNTFSTSFITV